MLAGMVGASGQAVAGGIPGERADAWARRLARRRRENFIVLSPLLPRRLRADFAAVYAFCRTADDLADEVEPTPEGRARALRDLADWRARLHACAAGEDAGHPVFAALGGAIRRRGLPLAPFERLLDAFEQDQRVRRYASWDDLIDYSRRSADPVGRLVLLMGGCEVPAVEVAGDERARASDAICTALQLVNFWQDVRRDLVERDRVYLPERDTGLDADWLRERLEEAPARDRARYAEALHALVDRTRTLAREGADLPRLVPPAIAPAVGLFVDAVEATARAIERCGHATLWTRPVVSGSARARMLARAAGLRLGVGRA